MRTESGKYRGIWIVCFATAVGLGLGGWSLLSVSREVKQPVALAGIAYARSDGCVRCHPSHDESWRRTFHRTMTQRATPETILGDFNNTAYTYQGVTSRFRREGDHYYIETLGPAGAGRYDVAMTVGSRRFQQYVAAVGDRHIRLPLAWDIDENRWFHLNGGFLYPDGSDFNTHTAVWDANCIFCHNVKARPGFDFAKQSFTSSVAELGIACEACHGPGEEHERRNANPLRRYSLYAGDRDPTIISPAELDTVRQVQICGHCHGQRLPNPLERIEEFATKGDPYTAGDDLAQVTTPITIHTEVEGINAAVRFWKDGTPRLTAYEYQGLLLSKGHANHLSCLSCHEMHGGDPKGMITPAMRGAEACLQCHRKIGDDVAGHTKHKVESTGSDCYACHMPRITYGLLNTHLTHRIQNPDPARAWRNDMPEACTLCHTNRTAAWAAIEMSRQYGKEPPADVPQIPEFKVAETVRALLAGDVVHRAVALNALAADESYTEDAKARLWAVPFCLLSMEDRYPAIRYFAWRSLRELLKRADIGSTLVELPDFDYLAEPEVRRPVVDAWRRWWLGFDKHDIPHPGGEVPLDNDLQLLDVATELVARQNETQIEIGE